MKWDSTLVSMQVIYSKTVGETFTDRANTTVLHHCTSPSFYEEVSQLSVVDLNYFLLYYSATVVKLSLASLSLSSHPPSLFFCLPPLSLSLPPSLSLLPPCLSSLSWCVGEGEAPSTAARWPPSSLHLLPHQL